MSDFGIFLRILNGVLMVGIPCLVGYFLVRRGKGGFRPVGIGVVGFILSQVGHIPFNSYLLLPGLARWGFDLTAQAGGGLLVFGVSVGLSAALFEELARFLAFRFWLRGDLAASTPWKYGIGHGGVEAILTGLLALYALIQAITLSGEGVLAGFPADQVDLIRSQVDAYWAVPWHLSLLGAWERISALLFHLGASVFVYKSVHEKNLLWFLVAILGHTALNAFAVVAATKMDFLLLEALLFAFAVSWALWAWFVRPRGEAEGELDPPPSSEIKLSASLVTSKDLEESRYD